MLRFRHPRRLRGPHGVVVAGLLACLALFLGQGTATASAAARSWSASYGTASTAGTWAYEDGSSSDTWNVVFDGQLTNTGSECYSVWFDALVDVSPPAYAKAGTLCGAGTAPVSYSRPSYGLGSTTNVLVAVCKGSTAHDDCGTWQWISTVWT